MLKSNIPAPFVTLPLGQSSAPLHRQLYEALRGAILSGQFGVKSRLPSTRFLAKQLSVSRMTVVNAYEQLFAEGYIEGKVGSGSYVASTLPEQLLQTHSKKSPSGSVPRPSQPSVYHLSKRGKWLAQVTAGSLYEVTGETFRAFGNGYPAVDEFPFAVWSRLSARRLRHPTLELLGYGDPIGYRPLRESVATYLKTARSVRCEAEQVFITEGAQQALDLVTRVLLDVNDPVWVEDPCYLGARNALESAGAKLVPVPVDDEGFSLAAALKINKQARLVYVTPSHQFPLGVTMSLARRLALLEWAADTGGLIVEDDYNSEFRYAGRPLASLQGLDQADRVIYIGTFSKTIFPSLRLGCMVVPPHLVDVFAGARSLIDRHSSTFNQATLADFINEGHFSRHVRRMRVLYEERQNHLVAAAKRELAGLLEVPAADAGMHLVGWLPAGVGDRAASESAARHGIKATPLSAFSLAPLPRSGLVLGYTSLRPKLINEGARKLAKALLQFKSV